jgi:hypothetical protein
LVLKEKDRVNLNQSNVIFKQMEKELKVLRDKVHDDNINKLINYNLNLEFDQATDENMYFITEA